MAWFTRNKPSVDTPEQGERHVRTEGLWLKCDGCGQVVWRKALEDNLQVCPKCNFHFKIDGCVGESFIRSYAILSKSTDQGDAILSWYGVTKAV